MIQSIDDACKGNGSKFYVAEVAYRPQEREQIIGLMELSPEDAERKRGAFKRAYLDKDDQLNAWLEFHSIESMVTRYLVKGFIYEMGHVLDRVPEGAEVFEGETELDFI